MLGYTLVPVYSLSGFLLSNSVALQTDGQADSSCLGLGTKQERALPRMYFIKG